MSPREKMRISRIDSGSTHSFFARVYRDTWVGSRSFADGRYGGPVNARRAAERWVKMADDRLPTIPPKPILRKATSKIYPDERRPNLRYYNVYLPEPAGEWKIEKLYYTTLDGQKKQSAKAHNLIAVQNDLLKTAFNQELAAWKKERDRIMDEIERVWPEVKGTE